MTTQLEHELEQKRRAKLTSKDVGLAITKARRLYAAGRYELAKEVLRGAIQDSEHVRAAALHRALEVARLAKRQMVEVKALAHEIQKQGPTSDPSGFNGDNNDT